MCLYLCVQQDVRSQCFCTRLYVCIEMYMYVCMYLSYNMNVCMHVCYIQYVCVCFHIYYDCAAFVLLTLSSPWVPADLARTQELMNDVRARGKKQIYILKPDAGCQGKGIKLVQVSVQARGWRWRC